MRAELDESAQELSGFQRECIDIFVRAAQVLAVPRSIGEIYGLLFASPEALSMEAIMRRLSISKGSASQGLRWLRDAGAVRIAYVPGERRDYFEAVTELRKLAAGFLEEQVQPHLRSGSDLLERLESSISDSEDPRFAQGRLKKLRRWHRFGGQVLPLLLRVAEKF